MNQMTHVIGILLMLALALLVGATEGAGSVSHQATWQGDQVLLANEYMTLRISSAGGSVRFQVAGPNDAGLTAGDIPNSVVCGLGSDTTRRGDVQRARLKWINRE